MKRKENIVLSDIPLPTTEKIERQLIAELVLFPQEIHESRNIIREAHFHNEKYSRAFAELCLMDERNEPIDYVTLGEKMGHEWVMKEFILDPPEVGYANSVVRHCYILKEGYIRREAYMMALRLLQQSARPDAEVEKIIGMVDGFKEIVNEATRGESTVSLEKAMLDLSDALTTSDNHIPTGFPILDDLLYGGFDAGQLIILAARPSVGKTAVALWMARKAGQAGKKAHLFSIEMTKEELAKRYLFAESSITPFDISRRSLDWNEYNRVLTVYKDSGIFINDSLNTMDGIAGEIMRQHRMGNLDIAFVDYLGLIKDVSQSTEKKVGTIGVITARFKEIAKTLRIPIVVLAQLNRNSVQNGAKRVPVLADLRDSGSIEQDADIVLMLDPKSDIVDNFGEDFAKKRDGLNMWLRKNRSGKRDVAIELETNETHTTYEQVGLITE